MSALPGLAWRSLANRRYSAGLSVLTIAISVMLLLGVERLRHEARAGFLRSISGVDLIVGARAHPVQLLLYSVFHLGEATQNVSWASYRAIAAAPEVAWTIPLALGDSHRGYRVVGTSGDYFEHLRVAGGQPLRFAAGSRFVDLQDAVVGAEVAAQLGYEVGDPLVLAHGAAAINLHAHDEQPFRVAGILARTGTPIDRAVHVSLGAIEAIHRNWRFGTRIGPAPSRAELARADLTPRAITAFHVGLKDRAASFAVQGRINAQREEALSAILPAVALQQLWGLLANVERALLATAACTVLAGLLGMLTAVLATLNERRREMAILRSVGASARTIFALLLAEAALLTAAGVACGVVLCQLLLALAAPWLGSRYGLILPAGLPTPGEWRLMALVLGAGIAVGLLPALLAYRRSLAEGMSVRT